MATRAQSHTRAPLSPLFCSALCSLRAVEERRIPPEETEAFLMSLARSSELGDLRDKIRSYSRLFH